MEEEEGKEGEKGTRSREVRNCPLGPLSTGLCLHVFMMCALVGGVASTERCQGGVEAQKDNISF